jgi:hypothetical protein
MEQRVLIVIISSIIFAIIGLIVIFFKIRVDLIEKKDLENRPHLKR